MVSSSLASRQINANRSAPESHASLDRPMNSRRKSSQNLQAPQRHMTPRLSIGSPLGGSQPVFVVETPLANRFVGFSTINTELITAREMIERARLESDQLLIEALWRAAASIYARCFASTASGMPKLEEQDHLQGATPELEKLHAFLISARHGFLSHAGNSILEQSSAQVVLSDPRVALGVVTLACARTVRSVPPPEELERLVHLVNLVRKHVQASMLAAHARALQEIRSMPIEDLYAQSQRLPGA